MNNYLLYNTLSDHSVYYLLKSGNICTCYIVSRYSVSFSCICCLCEDVDHDLVQSLINFFKGDVYKRQTKVLYLTFTEDIIYIISFIWEGFLC